MEKTRSCNECKGQGVKIFPAFRGTNGVLYAERRYPCRTCNETGACLLPDFLAIAKRIKGRKKGTLRSARPEDNNRAYFVWRMARFYGGADVTMPINASLLLGKDSYKDELEVFAMVIAKQVFGNNIAGPHRWAKVFRNDVKTIEGLPSSAYEGGRVADENKPIFEAAELL